MLKQNSWLNTPSINTVIQAACIHESVSRGSPLNKKMRVALIAATGPPSVADGPPSGSVYWSHPLFLVFLPLAHLNYSFLFFCLKELFFKRSVDQKRFQSMKCFQSRYKPASTCNQTALSGYRSTFLLKWKRHLLNLTTQKDVSMHPEEHHVCLKWEQGGAGVYSCKARVSIGSFEGSRLALLSYMTQHFVLLPLWKVFLR